MDMDVRLAFCNEPPYAVFDKVQGDVAERGDWHHSGTQHRSKYVNGSSAACDVSPVWRLFGMLQSGAADIAVYPFTIQWYRVRY
jgi:hypothetical protein